MPVYLYLPLLASRYLMAKAEQCQNNQKYTLDPSDLNNARYLTLSFHPFSESAFALRAKLQESIIVASDKTKGRGRPPNDTAIANAALLIVAEIIDVAKGKIQRSVHHGLAAGKFTGKPISYRHFKAAMTGLEKLKLVRIRKGSYGHKSMFADAENPGVPCGYNTRWHPTLNLIELGKAFNITYKNIESHFQITLPDEPIILRESSKGDWQTRVKGRLVKFPETPNTKRLEDEVREINEFLKDFKLTGATHRGYRRIFNQGDDLRIYKWDKGGRLYGSGDEDSYLIIKKAKRKAMLIDGDRTVEIDVRASYLTIFHAMHNITLDVQNDPYEFPKIHRDIVKLWMVIAFGAGKPPMRWSTKAAQYFRDNINPSKAIGDVYNLRTLVTPTITAKFPVLNKLNKGGIDCFDLMNRESNAMVASMLRLLRSHKIPSYSVHDCLIVKKQDQELAKRVFGEEYFKATNAVPWLKITSTT